MSGWGLWGSDKEGGDDAPAIQARNAGLIRREEIALTRENSKAHGRNQAPHTIKGRMNKDDDAAGEYKRRH
jgi:hypothetical protein